MGTSFQRNYQWPNQIASEKENFRFGVPTIGSESTKEVLYQKGGAMEEKQEVQKMYRKTHGNFAPGEQRERDYQWTLDKTQHRFGYGEQKQENGAANSIHHERAEGSFPKTVIVKKTVED